MGTIVIEVCIVFFVTESQLVQVQHLDFVGGLMGTYSFSLKKQSIILMCTDLTTGKPIENAEYDIDMQMLTLNHLLSG